MRWFIQKPRRGGRRSLVTIRSSQRRSADIAFANATLAFGEGFLELLLADASAIANAALIHAAAILVGELYPLRQHSDANWHRIQR